MKKYKIANIGCDDSNWFDTKNIDDLIKADLVVKVEE